MDEKMKKMFLILALVLVGVASIGQAALFTEGFEGYAADSYFAEPGTGPVNGWYTPEVHYVYQYWALHVKAVAANSAWGGSPGSKYAELWGWNDIPYLMNYFNTFSVGGNSYAGSIGHDLTGSGIGFKWDAYSNPSSTMSFIVNDQASYSPISVELGSSGLIIGGVNKGGLEALGLTNDDRFRRYELLNVSVAAQTFDFKISEWDTATSSFVQKYSTTGLGFARANVTSLTSFTAYIGTPGYTFVALDNFQVVPEPATLATLFLGSMLIFRKKK